MCWEIHWTSYIQFCCLVAWICLPEGFVQHYSLKLKISGTYYFFHCSSVGSWEKSSLLTLRLNFPQEVFTLDKWSFQVRDWKWCLVKYDKYGTLSLYLSDILPSGKHIFYDDLKSINLCLVVILKNFFKIECHLTFSLSGIISSG